MSRYDRRTWQRPPGERTADPEWAGQAAATCARPAKGPRPLCDVDKHTIGSATQHRALRPRYPLADIAAEE